MNCPNCGARGIGECEYCGTIIPPDMSEIQDIISNAKGPVIINNSVNINKVTNNVSGNNNNIDNSYCVDSYNTPVYGDGNTIYQDGPIYVRRVEESNEGWGWLIVIGAALAIGIVCAFWENIISLLVTALHVFYFYVIPTIVIGIAGWYLLKFILRYPLQIFVTVSIVGGLFGVVLGLWHLGGFSLFTFGLIPLLVLGGILLYWLKPENKK